MSNKDFYRAFEDRHRGSRELIKERVSIYLPFILPLKEKYPDVISLDIGCGRGEWLELLKNNGMIAKGIDVDEGMLQACHDLDLDALQGEGISYLRDQPDDSMIVISAFHVIEHILFEDVQELVRESLRVLKPGGLLILETPNPENIKVATENFFLDPTHIRPIPSALLSFLTEFYGYARTKILRLQESKNLIHQKNISLQQVIEGASPDYAVIAQKEASEEMLKQFNELFSEDFGLPLQSLTEKFENRLQKIEEIVNQVKVYREKIQDSILWKIIKALRLIKPAIKAFLNDIDKKIINIIQYFAFKKKRPKEQHKKLLIDCSFIYTTDLNTGIQRVVRSIVNNIDEYTNKNDFDLVTVAFLYGSIVRVDIDQKKEVYLSKPVGLFNKIKSKLQLYISLYGDIENVYKDDILLMLDSTWHLENWPSIEYAKNRGAVIIGVTYDLIPILYPQYCEKDLVKSFSDWYEKTLIYFDGYIAISETVMLDIQEYIKNKDIDINNYSFNYFRLGSDFKEIKYKLSDIREELKSLYQSNKSIYLIVSTIEPRKNHQYLFDTFKKLWKEGIDVSLVIVGKVGWMTENILEEIKSHHEYEKRLWIFNDLNDYEVSYCYKNSKALLFPSFTEGFGLPIIESLQNGLPVLASDTRIHHEVGRNMIDYFDITNTESLFNHLIDVENGKTMLKKVNIENIEVLSWKESAEELFSKVITMSHKDNSKEK